MIRLDEKTRSETVLKSEHLIKKTVLNPTTITRDIINLMLVSEDYLIAGGKGCGKTFSYLTYSYFSSFIVKYRLNL